MQWYTYYVDSFSFFSPPTYKTVESESDSEDEIEREKRNQYMSSSEQSDEDSSHIDAETAVFIPRIRYWSLLLNFLLHFQSN